jgi:hypothetical protein
MAIVAVPHVELRVFSRRGLNLCGVTPTIVVTETTAAVPVPHVELRVFSRRGLHLCGATPTVISTHRAAPASESLVFSKFAPSVQRSFFPTPGAGTLLLAGKTPTVLRSQSATPAAGVLALTGMAPNVVAIDSVGPNSAALILAGHAPSVERFFFPAPGVTTLTLAGQAPSTSLNINVAATALNFTGHKPTIATGKKLVRVGGMVLAGHAPVSDLGDATPATQVGAAVLAGHIPVSFNLSSPDVFPASASLTLTGQATTYSYTVTRIDQARLRLVDLTARLKIEAIF